LCVADSLTGVELLDTSKEQVCMVSGIGHTTTINWVSKGLNVIVGFLKRELLVDVMSKKNRIVPHLDPLNCILF
jgi:hypothetical protein